MSFCIPVWFRVPNSPYKLVRKIFQSIAYPGGANSLLRSGLSDIIELLRKMIEKGLFTLSDKEYFQSRSDPDFKQKQKQDLYQNG